MFNNLEELGIGLVKAFINKNKNKIISMLGKKEKMTISEIQRELDISYKETYRHIKELVEAGILKRKHNSNEKCQPVYVSLKLKSPPTP